jgi:oxygen-independent coproporphyrinogen-3 oxidase
MASEATRTLVEKYSAPVPRYTSYPTAPQFSPDVDRATYSHWLRSLESDTDLSLYLHIPYCEELCWYCGCNTKATKQYEPLQTYLRSLINEISFVTAHLMPSQIVKHIHWGGGSPNILKPRDILRLANALQAYFSICPDVEFAVEIDPRHHTAEQAEAFAAAGVTRLSLGVQDFEKRVQIAINRLQSFDKTAEAIRDFRARGVASINIDLVYGLPYQTLESAERTIDQVIELMPDRIALFGYAHLPSRIKHQRLIPDDSLPSAMLRYEQSQRLAGSPDVSRYVRIGLDHFALPSDPLALAPARRNFQGYTSDGANALIGLGASAIGQLPMGYVQNVVSTNEYNRNVRDYGLATHRGHRLDSEDRIRAFVIERLMCDLVFPLKELVACFGEKASDAMRQIADRIVDGDNDGLVARRSDGGFEITPAGRPFVRTIASQFDAYLNHKPVKYSVGV